MRAVFDKVLLVDQTDPAGVAVDERKGIFPAPQRPEGIQLQQDELRVGAVHQVVQDGFSVKMLKLMVVVMIVKGHAVPGTEPGCLLQLPDLFEDIGDIPVKVCRQRDVLIADFRLVLQKTFYSLRAIQGSVGNMHPDDLRAQPVQQTGSFPGAHVQAKIAAAGEMAADSFQISVPRLRRFFQGAPGVLRYGLADRCCLKSCFHGHSPFPEQFDATIMTRENREVNAKMKTFPKRRL